jgi:hypothetical protein
MVADIGVCDYLGDILASLESNAFQRCFVAWVASVMGMLLKTMSRETITYETGGQSEKDVMLEDMG